MTKNRKWMAVCVALATVMMQGCSTTSSRFGSDGEVQEVVFPDPDSAWPKGGLFPNIDNLRNLAPGMTKGQLYPLLDRPNFNEGVVAVREWDYLFNFRTGRPAPDDVAVCQFKVIFDNKLLSKSFHWKPESCAEYLKLPTPAAPVPAAQVGAPVMNRTLSGDALFSFNGDRLEDMTPKGREDIEALAVDLAALKNLNRIQVLAYTDRIGSKEYNQALSQRRADTVRAILASRGIDSRYIIAEGRGDAEPVSRCGNLPREKLITCLAPDRRVRVSAW